MSRFVDFTDQNLYFSFFKLKSQNLKQTYMNRDNFCRFFTLLEGLNTFFLYVRLSCFFFKSKIKHKNDLVKV